MACGIWRTKTIVSLMLSFKPFGTLSVFLPHSAFYCAVYFQDVFRCLFHFQNHHPGATTRSVFDALKSIFSQYAFADDALLPPDELRNALAVLYAPEGRFRLGEIDDAAEALDAILDAIHCAVAGGKRPDDCTCNPLCAAHQTFGLGFVEQLVCQTCGGASEPLPFRSYSIHVPAQQLLALRRRYPEEPFDRLVRTVLFETKRCPEAVGA